LRRSIEELIGLAEIIKLNSDKQGGLDA